MIFDRGDELHNEEQTISSNDVEKNWTSTCKRKKVNFILYHSQKSTQNGLKT